MRNLHQDQLKMSIVFFVTILVMITMAYIATSMVLFHELDNQSTVIRNSQYAFCMRQNLQGDSIAIGTFSTWENYAGQYKRDLVLANSSTGVVRSTYLSAAESRVILGDSLVLRPAANCALAVKEGLHYKYLRVTPIGNIQTGKVAPEAQKVYKNAISSEQ